MVLEYRPKLVNRDKLGNTEGARVNFRIGKNAPVRYPRNKQALLGEVSISFMRPVVIAAN